MMVKPTKTEKEIMIEKKIKDLFENEPLNAFKEAIQHLSR